MFPGGTQRRVQKGTAANRTLSSQRARPANARARRRLLWRAQASIGPQSISADGDFFQST